MTIKLNGVMNAMITPMKPDGSPDLDKIAPLVEFQIENGVHSLLAMAGTGEYVAMTMKQREMVIKEVIATAAGRVPVVAGAMEPGIGECLIAAHMFTKAGVSALLILPPYYVSPPQAGIYNFFKKLNDEVDCPLIVYNNPGRVYNNILPETMEKMVADLPNMAGIKECGNFVQLLDLVGRIGDKVSVLSGMDLVAPMAYAVGGAGAILATSCLIPKESVQMYDLAKAGNLQEAMEIHFRFFHLFQLIFSGGYHPAPLKYAMSLAGHQVGEYGIPLIEPEESLKKAIYDEMTKHGLINN